MLVARVPIYLDHIGGALVSSIKELIFFSCWSGSKNRYTECAGPWLKAEGPASDETVKRLWPELLVHLNKISVAGAGFLSRKGQKA